MKKTRNILMTYVKIISFVLLINYCSVGKSQTYRDYKSNIKIVLKKDSTFFFQQNEDISVGSYKIDEKSFINFDMIPDTVFNDTYIAFFEQNNKLIIFDYLGYGGGGSAYYCVTGYRKIITFFFRNKYHAYKKYLMAPTI